MSGTVFTIGYEGAEPERFLDTLRGAGVGTVADVRAIAASRKRGFSKNILAAHLDTAGIGYRHFRDLGTPKEGRQAARAGDGALLRRIYCEALREPEAEAAFEELARLAGERPICLLCFERDPAVCHRRILAERLEQRGFTTVDLTVL